MYREILIKLIICIHTTIFSKYRTIVESMAQIIITDLQNGKCPYFIFAQKIIRKNT